MAAKRLSQQQRREKTSKALLETAAEVFIKHGYQGASIDLIAEKAGYTKGAVYSHFKNKEALFLAVFSARAEVQFQILRENIEKPDVLKSIVDKETQKKLISKHYDHNKWIMLVLEYLLYAQRNPKAKKQLKDLMTNTREAMATILAQRYKEKVDLNASAIEKLAMKQQIVDMGFAVMYLIDNELPLDIYKELLSSSVSK